MYLPTDHNTGNMLKLTFLPESSNFYFKAGICCKNAKDSFRWGFNRNRFKHPFKQYKMTITATNKDPHYFNSRMPFPYSLCTCRVIQYRTKSWLNALPTANNLNFHHHHLEKQALVRNNGIKRIQNKK